MTDRQWRGAGFDLLLSVVRDLQRLGRLTPTEWQALIPAAEGARLLPRLATDAERLRLNTSAPGWARDRLTSARVRGEEFQRAVKWEIARIHRALLPIGVRPVFLKGAAYIAAGLPCGVGRVVADVDILVAEVELPDVEAALRQHGWEFEPLDPYDERYYREWMHELPPMRHRERGTMVDVHHRILPRTGRAHPPTERLLQKAIEVGGTRVLSPEHMVLHSAAHLFQDGEIAGALRDLVDLRDLLEKFTQSPAFERELATEAEAISLGRPLFYAARYVELVGGRPGFKSELSGSGAPPRIILTAMDGLVSHSMADTGTLAAWMLYVRSHWLKMPLRMLVPHLLRKLWMPLRRSRQ